MKVVKTLSLFLLLSSAIINSPLYGKADLFHAYFMDYPARTICIKNPEAADATKFFAGSTTILFEVYKPGTKEDLDKIIKTLSKDSNVQSCLEGKLTGDFQAITLTLKSTKDKAWFAALFKKAGLNTIKINNNPVVEVDKM